MTVIKIVIDYINNIKNNRLFLYSDIKAINSLSKYDETKLQRKIFRILELCEKCKYVTLNYSTDKNTFRNYNLFVHDGQTIYFNYTKIAYIPFSEYLTIGDLTKIAKDENYIKTYERKCKIKMLKK
jgi:hypothetical protein